MAARYTSATWLVTTEEMKWRRDVEEALGGRKWRLQQEGEEVRVGELIYSLAGHRKWRLHSAAVQRLLKKKFCSVLV